jgi:NADH:ubiquinone oxidoreductase subunit F (NADH-binding)
VVDGDRVLRGIRSVALSHEQHVAVHGPLPDARALPGPALVHAVQRSGLRGRGGAHVATGLKLHAAAARGRRGAVVVANGAESEPASGKDAVLLAHAPHLVLDGMVLAARAVGAGRAVLYVHPGTGGRVPALRRALAERAADARGGPALELALAPDGYVAGQETAAIAHLNGGPALPTTVPPRPFERGVGGRPTLVCNVETLAHVALIARHGPEWFREAGVPTQPGTALVTLGGAVGDPGVYELGYGTRMADLLARAGGLAEPAGALLVGGYGGTWLSALEMEQLVLSEGDPLLVDGSVGTGVLFVLPAACCGVRESARVLDYLAGETAGQCGPCVHGLRAIADAFGELAAGRADRGTLLRLARWGGDVAGRGACRHPDGAARFLAGALRVFAAEVEEHLRGRCGAARDGVLPIPTARSALAA